MRKIVAVCVPLLCLYAASADSETDIIVAACLEQGVAPGPCTLFLVKTDEGNFEVLHEFPPPAGVVDVLAIEPTKRVMAVWSYENERAGSLILADVDNPGDRKDFRLPFGPTCGGYFALDRYNICTTITESLGGLVFEASDDSKCITKQVSEVSWDRVLLLGSNEWGARRCRPIEVKVDPESGMLSRVRRDQASAMDMHFSKDVAERYRQETDGGKLVTLAALAINTPATAVVVIWLRKPEDRHLRPIYVALDKASGEWTWDAFRQSVPKSRHGRGFMLSGNWLILQSLLGDTKATEKGIDVPETVCEFYSLALQKEGEWTAPPNTEPLLVTEDRLYSRCEDSILKAEFHKGQVGELEVVCRSPRFRDVHWALLEKPAKNERAR